MPEKNNKEELLVERENRFVLFRLSFIEKYKQGSNSFWTVEEVRFISRFK